MVLFFACLNQMTSVWLSYASQVLRERNDVVCVMFSIFPILCKKLIVNKS